MKCWLTILMAGLLLLAVSCSLASQVGLITINGAIGPATSEYISRAIGLATVQHSECLIVQLDTPGGLLESTKQIVQTFYAAKIPIVVYVSPAGASAGSAGVFITLAADVAVMSPNTTIGAAHPVAIGPLGGGETSGPVMKQKLENYAVSFVESIADKRQRNVEWARSAVLDSAATTAEKALAQNVIDLMAEDLPSLLQQLNGRMVNGRNLQTAGAAVVVIPMNAWEKFSQAFLRPEVMFVLMLMVIYGIIGELSNPGAVLPGVAGAVALLLVLYMSAVLPVNITGLALIGLALVLFIADIYAPTHGVLTAGGIAAFFLGAMMLFSRTAPGFGLSLRWILPATAFTALFFILFVAQGIRAQFKPPCTGQEAMSGKTANALTEISANAGTVFFDGEIWNARSEVSVAVGHVVEIVTVEGLILKVKPTTQPREKL